MAILVKIKVRSILIFKKESPTLRNFKKKSKLDHFLWFVENYLPQKNSQATLKELPLKELEALTINQIQKFASLRSNSLTPFKTNNKISFTIGNWALPYLKFLKQIGLIK